jgi:hypothetical protein
VVLREGAAKSVLDWICQSPTNELGHLVGEDGREPLQDLERG